MAAGIKGKSPSCYFCSYKSTLPAVVSLETIILPLKYTKPIMKYLALPVIALLLSSCAGARVSKTYVSTGAHSPEAIYIRPFTTDKLIAKGDFGSSGDRDLRIGQAPQEFARDLKVELAKIAPAVVINEDQSPQHGWVAEGEFDLINTGVRAVRGTVGFIGAGKSSIKMHVKVSDARSGQILYAFDVQGGSGLTGPFGNTGAPGAGLAAAFDYHNAAETIMMALSIDGKNEAIRSTP